MSRTKTELQDILESGTNLDLRRIYLNDTVDDDMAYRVLTTLDLLARRGSDKPITIVLNTYGGDVYQGLAIYDAIRRFPGEVTIIGTGAVMSMGALLLQAADEKRRFLTPNTTVMLHNGTESFDGDIKSFQTWGQFSKKLNIRLNEILAERTGHTAKYWDAKQKADVVLTADEAVKLRLADSIVEEV